MHRLPAVFFIADHADISADPAITKAVGDSFKQAGVGPEDIDVAELHDCVHIHEVKCLENTGLFKKGKGIYSAAEGKTHAEVQLPINLSGGL